uniref:Uncharacterized protein n=2 Tax=Solanum tuberosum TaxID=4113 RepID=M1CWQ2_SOLTU
MSFSCSLFSCQIQNPHPSNVKTGGSLSPFPFLIALTFGANFISTVLKSIHIKNALDMNWIDQGLSIQKMANLERAAKIEAEFMDHQRSCNPVVKVEPHSASSDADTSDQKENYVQLHHVKSHVAYSYTDTDAESSVSTIEDLPRHTHPCSNKTWIALLSFNSMQKLEQLFPSC